jgi:hypothetical protein
MLIHVKFSERQLSDARLTALLKQNGWEDDPLWGKDDAGTWHVISAGFDSENPRHVARKLVEPFLTIGQHPLEVKFEVIPLHVRIANAAQDISVHDLARANLLYALADELRS